MSAQISTHWNRCRVCNANFPSDRLLNIHVRESHDSYFAALAARQHMVQNECTITARNQSEHPTTCFVLSYDSTSAWWLAVEENLKAKKIVKRTCEKYTVVIVALTLRFPPQN